MTRAYLALLAALWALATAGCEAKSEPCDEPQPCPAGTARVDSSQAKLGVDLSLGLDLSSYSVTDRVFKRFGEGNCEYACEVLQPCPEGLYPYMSAECFTCSTADADGNVAPGACADAAGPPEPDATSDADAGDSTDAAPADDAGPPD